MIAEGVDPRNCTGEFDNPVYRVYFWSRPPGSNDDVGYACDEYRLTDAADVHEVLAWADARVGDDSYVLYVEDKDPQQDGKVILFRLAGVDPTALRSAQ